MAITAGEFITKLAQMAGVQTSDPDLISVLSSSEFASYKLPETVTSKINSGLLTIDSARNNETLRKHFHAEILNGLDSNIESVMEKFGIEQDIAEQIKAERKTTDKYNKLIEQLNELHSKKAKATTSADKKELTEEIAKLNNQVRDLSEKLKTAPAERDQYWSGKLQQKAVQSLLNSFKYFGENSGVPKDVLIEAASVLINRKLNEAKLRIQYDVENDTPSLKTESGMDHYKDNSPVSLKDFAASVLAENKMLDIPPPSGGSNQNPNNQPTPKVVQSGAPDKWSRYAAAIDAELAGNK